MTKMSKKMNSADMCRKTGDAEIPGMAVVAQITARSDGDVQYKDEFSLFDDCDEKEISRYYSDKKTSWINVNFEEQLE